MTWFGFGFNGFGQIKPQKDGESKQISLLTPTTLDCLCSCQKTDMRHGTEAHRYNVVASWSRKAAIHINGEHHVCLSGFGSSPLNTEEGSVLVPESEGCEDVLLSEGYMTLKFGHRAECWSLKRNGRALVWTGTLDATENAGQAVRLPLVPGGYLAFKPPYFLPISPHLKAASLALGTDHAVLLTASGIVYTWGSGSHGQLGHSNLVSEVEPHAVEALWGVPVKSVSAGGWHSACISAGGDLYVWGWNESGQIGLPSTGLREQPHKGQSTENDEVMIGRDDDEGTNNMLISIQAFPALVDVAEASEISRVSCGSRHTAAVTSTGELYTWGWGHYGQLGHGSESSSDEPKVVEYFLNGGMRVEDIVCGLWNTFVSALPKNLSPS